MKFPRLKELRPNALELLTLEDRITPSVAGDWLVTADASVAAEIASSGIASEVRHLGFGIYRVDAVPGVSQQAVADLLYALAGIGHVERDREFSSLQEANDPRNRNGDMWNLHNSGQSGGTVDADLDAPEGWELASGTGRTVVAGIDSGVDYSHPDLADNIWLNNAEIPASVRAALVDVDANGVISFRDLNASENAGKVRDQNRNGIIDAGDLLRSLADGGWEDGRDNEDNGFIDDLIGWDFAENDNTPSDENGHGTHVAGTIGAVGNNGLGVSGVAWNTRIMPVRILDTFGNGSTSTAIAAINYAVAQGARILNNSWGGGESSPSLQTAVNAARAKGVIFVAAAGNNASDNDRVPAWPANIPLDNVVSVAATDRNDRLSSFSNFGQQTVTLAAPGESISSTLPFGDYGWYSGTSMAAPHVSGALAVLWDANPNWTYTQILDRLKQSVDRLPSLAGKVSSGGRLNLHSLLAGASAAASAESGATIMAAAFQTNIYGAIVRVRLTFDRAVNPATFTPQDVVLNNPTGGRSTVLSVAAVAGSNNLQFDVSFVAQSAPGTYRLTVGPDLRDLANQMMNQDRDGTNGERLDDAFATTATVGESAEVLASRSSPEVIRDHQTATMVLDVPSNSTLANRRIADINVTVNLTHPNVGDLILTLVAPDGTRIVLSNRRGGTGDNFTATVFDDEASGSIGSGDAPFRGSFRPESTLSALDGKSLIGRWRLEVRDAAKGNVGQIDSFSLSVTTVPVPARIRSLGLRVDPPQEHRGRIALAPLPSDDAELAIERFAPVPRRLPRPRS